MNGNSVNEHHDMMNGVEFHQNGGHSLTRGRPQ